MACLYRDVAGGIMTLNESECRGAMCDPGCDAASRKLEQLLTHGKMLRMQRRDCTKL